MKGHRTYIVAALVVVQAVLAWLSGDIDVAQAVNQALLGTGLATLRAAKE